MKSVKRTALRVAAATVASGVLAAGAVALAGAASASTLSPAHGAHYSFRTLDNDHDLTFNQLLGINDEGVIAGYFGSGAAGHPNKGYVLLPPYGQGNYINENFIGSV
jgi:carbohydrate-selective porin OprB